MNNSMHTFIDNRVLANIGQAETSVPHELVVQANRNPESFGTVVENWLDKCGLDSGDLTEAFKRHNFVPNERQYLDNWLTAKHRPSWKSGHIQAILQLVETTSAQLLQEVEKAGPPRQPKKQRRNKGQRDPSDGLLAAINRATPPPVAFPSDPDMAQLVLEAAVKPRQLSEAIRKMLGNKSITPARLAETFKAARLFPDTTPDIRAWLEMEKRFSWSQKHLSATLHVLGVTGHDLLDAMGIEQRRPATTPAPMPPQAAPVPPPAPSQVVENRPLPAPPVRRPSPKARAARAAWEKRRQPKSLHPLAMLAESKRNEFGDMVKTMLGHTRQTYHLLHGFLHKHGAVGKTSANTYILLAGGAPWDKQGRAESTACYFGLSPERMLEAFQAYLAGTLDPANYVQKP